MLTMPPNCWPPRSRSAAPSSACLIATRRSLRLRPTDGMLEQAHLPLGRPGEERPGGGLFEPRTTACAEVLEDLETHDVGESGEPAAKLRLESGDGQSAP